MHDPLFGSAGLSPIEAEGAREKYTSDQSSVHMPCTVFPQAPSLCTFREASRIQRELRGEFFVQSAGKLPVPKKRLRKSPVIGEIFRGA